MPLISIQNGPISGRMIFKSPFSLLNCFHTLSINPNFTFGFASTSILGLGFRRSRVRMVYKRPFHGEGTYEVGCKQARQEVHSAQESPIKGIVHCNDTLQKLPSDEGENTAGNSDGGKITREVVCQDLNGADEELQKNGSGSNSRNLSVNGHPNDNNAEPEAALTHPNDDYTEHEDALAHPADEYSEPQTALTHCNDGYAEPESAYNFSYFPPFLEFDHQVAALPQAHDLYSVLLNHLPHKVVPVGPDHQADVPEWIPKRITKSFGCLDDSDKHIVPSSTHAMDDGDSGVKLMGNCVIPMPDMESSTNNFYISGGSRSFCSCLDLGSVRCARQHINEVREKFRENLGEKVFEELGFCDMGEDVARKWKEEEEQLFNEVILSNPASMGNKFWDQLSVSFPSRTKKDLVSYYFNVFMLRQRAKQNRLDPLNVDSDNDEWQVSNLGMTEEEKYPIVEFIDCYPSALNQENHEEELLGGNELEGEPDAGKDFDYFIDNRYSTGEDGTCDVSAAVVGNDIGDRGTGSILQVSGKIFSNNGKDGDAEDNSCKSYEHQRDKVDSVDLRADAREYPNNND